MEDNRIEKGTYTLCDNTFYPSGVDVPFDPSGKAFRVGRSSRNFFKRIQLLLSIPQILIFSCPYDNFSGGLYQKLCQDQRRRNKDFLFI